MSIFEHLGQEKSILKGTLHPENNPIINTVIENKIKMIEWFENIILDQETEADLKKIEKILNERDYYVNKRKSCMERQETFDNDDNIKMIEWFLFLFRNRFDHVKNSVQNLK